MTRVDYTRAATLILLVYATTDASTDDKYIILSFRTKTSRTKRIPVLMLLPSTDISVQKQSSSRNSNRLYFVKDAEDAACDRTAVNQQIIATYHTRYVKPNTRNT